MRIVVILATLFLISANGSQAEEKTPAGSFLFYEKSASSAEVEAGWSALLQPGSISGIESEFRSAHEQNPGDFAAAAGLALSIQGKYREAANANLVALKNAATSPWLELQSSRVEALRQYLEKPEVLATALKEMLSQPGRMPLINQILCRCLYYEALLSTHRHEEALSEAAALPFIRDWLLLGPLDNREKAGFDNNEQISALEQTLANPDMDKEYGGRSGKIRWLRLQTIPARGVADLSALLQPGMENLAYLTTRIIADEDTEAALVIGATGRASVFLNNFEIAGWNGYQMRYAPIQRIFKLRFSKGENWLSLKLAGDNISPLLCSAMLLPVPPADLEKSGEMPPTGKHQVKHDKNVGKPTTQA